MNILRRIVSSTFNENFYCKEHSYRGEDLIHLYIYSGMPRNFAIFDDPLKVYDYDSLDNKQQLNDGTSVMVTYDYINEKWLIINLDSGEKLYPNNFNIDQQSIYTTISHGRETLSSWKELKKWFIE